MNSKHIHIHTYKKINLNIISWYYVYLYFLYITILFFIFISVLRLLTYVKQRWGWIKFFFYILSSTTKYIIYSVYVLFQLKAKLIRMDRRVGLSQRHTVNPPLYTPTSTITSGVLKTEQGVSQVSLWFYICFSALF